MTPNSENEKIAELRNAVEKLHGAKAVFMGTTKVHERFEGQTVWEGTVSQFELKGHPTAQICYAWSRGPVPTLGLGKRFYSVLHTLIVDSPEKAVRAQIVHEHHVNGNPFPKRTKRTKIKPK